MVKTNRKEESYNGWRNWATWNTYNWLSSYESNYNYFNEMVKTYTFSQFKEEVKSWIKLHEFDNLHNYLNIIDYRQLFKNLRGDI